MRKVSAPAILHNPLCGLNTGLNRSPSCVSITGILGSCAACMRSLISPSHSRTVPHTRTCHKLFWAYSVHVHSQPLWQSSRVQTAAGCPLVQSASVSSESLAFLALRVYALSTHSFSACCCSSVPSRIW